MFKGCSKPLSPRYPIVISVLKKEGVWVEYLENGKVKYKDNYKNGVLIYN